MMADESDDAAILRKYGFEPDPVIEAYKKHVDRTLLRQNLQRSMEWKSAGRFWRRRLSSPTKCAAQELAPVAVDCSAAEPTNRRL